MANLLLVFSTLTVPPVGAGDWLGAATKNWVDCSSGFRTIDCIESIEFSDTSVEKKNVVTGAIDYGSVKWIKTTFIKNTKYKYGESIDQLTRSDDGCNSWGSQLEEEIVRK